MNRFCDVKAGKSHEYHVFESAGHGFLRGQDQTPAHQKAAEDASSKTVTLSRAKLGKWFRRRTDSAHDRIRSTVCDADAALVYKRAVRALAFILAPYAKALLLDCFFAPIDVASSKRRLL